MLLGTPRVLTGLESKWYRKVGLVSACQPCDMSVPPANRLHRVVWQCHRRCVTRGWGGTGRTWCEMTTATTECWGAAQGAPWTCLLCGIKELERSRQVPGGEDVGPFFLSSPLLFSSSWILGSPVFQLFSQLALGSHQLCSSQSCSAQSSLVWLLQTCQSQWLIPAAAS